MKKHYWLNEDTTMMYNQWVSGQAKREALPGPITVSDIVNRYRNRYDKPKIFPFPLNLIIDFLGDIFVKCAEFRRMLAESFKNPIIKDDKNKIQAIRELNEKIEKIQSLIFSCTDDLNKIVEK